MAAEDVGKDLFESIGQMAVALGALCVNRGAPVEIVVAAMVSAVAAGAFNGGMKREVVVAVLNSAWDDIEAGEPA